MTTFTGLDELGLEVTGQLLERLFAAEEHTEVECTWGIYQRMIYAYRAPDRTAGRAEMASVIETLSAPRTPGGRRWGLDRPAAGPGTARWP